MVILSSHIPFALISGILHDEELSFSTLLVLPEILFDQEM